MFARRDPSQLQRPFGSAVSFPRKPVAESETKPKHDPLRSVAGARALQETRTPVAVVPDLPLPSERISTYSVVAAPLAEAAHRVSRAREHILGRLTQVMDLAETARMKREEVEGEITTLTGEIARSLNLELSASEEQQLKDQIVNDLLGLGPIEPLIQDPSVSDVMVNGPKQVYVERAGRLELTDVTFRDRHHVMVVATRICAKVHRRVDESNPLVDARLEDGSRVNIIIPPLALDGPFISIRKFSKRPITLARMVEMGSMSVQMAEVLAVAAASRLNIVISGGTGAGKTTLLNALSRMIDHGERIVTIEDAAELQLQQPHVLRHETRPANIEGEGEVTMRDLVRNSLRMRPDRIILGEARGAEAFDMLQAMNTGHEGSMCTIHANRPREALSRLENMICMSGITLPGKAVRQQIADAINLIVQVKRCRDGVRRVVNVTEVVGMEHEVITTQDLFSYVYEETGHDGRLRGHWVCAGVVPYFFDKARDFDLGDRLRKALLDAPAQTQSR
jgi:pilus assembly protein CpaF